MRITCVLLAAAAWMAFSPAAWAADALPAFPGAEGYGAAAVGGRGGRVVHVTNLNPSGPGSFLDACEVQTGPRIVVFDVSGVIPGPANRKYHEIHVRDGRITIAGQTSPGGVVFEGLLRVEGTPEKLLEDVIIRHMRFRPDARYAGAPGGPSVNTDALGVNFAQRAIVDHVSVSWGCDELVDMINSREITLQWSTIEESDIQFEGGDEPHNFALIIGYTGGHYTIHHNLFAHHHDRAPAYTKLKQECDFVDNVLYDFATGCSTPMGNLVGNTCLAGPGAVWGFPRIYHPPATIAMPDCSPYKNAKAAVYMRGNWLGWAGGYFDAPAEPSPALTDTPLKTTPLKIHPAQQACDLVLGSAGALPRDAVTSRTVYEVRTGTGSWGRHEPPGGAGAGLDALRKPLPDADGDGMPDAWEKAHGLDPAEPADANNAVPAGATEGDRHKGYTWIECYINSRADELESAARAADARRAGPGPVPASEVFEKPRKPIADLVADIVSQDQKREKTDTRASFHAILNLSRMDPAVAAEAIPLLLEAMPTDDQRKACFVTWAIGAIGGPQAKQAVPALLAVVRKDWEVVNSKWNFNPRGFAVWALGRVGPDAGELAAPELAKALSGRDLWARRPAAWALSRMGAAAAPATDALIAALSAETSGNWNALYDLHIHAVEALAGIGAAAVPALVKALDSKDAAVRRGAAEALGCIGEPARASVGRLIALTADKEPRVQIAAAEAAIRLDPNGQSFTAQSVSLLLYSKDYAVRAAAATALGGLVNPTGAIREVLADTATGDPRPEVCYAAEKSLKAIAPEKP
ncbi:MAG: hypothetical protein BIFFINMI_03898 [Phycisphaerae bacterium]|nr:hypothetical protein [Phycisphaerae bacterium]